MPVPINRFSIDRIVYNSLNKSTFLCKLKPNYITLFNILLTIAIIYLFYIKKYLGLLLLIVVINRILDCLDGIVARKCNKYSKLGNYLDHINDTILMVFVLLIILYKYPTISIYVRSFIIIFLVYVTFLSSISIFSKEKTQYSLIYNNKFYIFLHDNTIIITPIIMTFLYYFKEIYNSL